MVNKYWKSLMLVACMSCVLPAFAFAEEEAAAEAGAAEAGEVVMERDPFQPFSSAPSVSVSSTDEGVEARQSLVSYPLESFRLIGIMRSSESALAVMQTRDLKDYIVTTGDSVGKEGGVIEAIRKDGISVRIGDDVEDIPVSNKVEKVNDKKSK